MIPDAPGVVLCPRCGKRCRLAAPENPQARPLRKTTDRKRGACLECCVAGLFQQPTDGDDALPTALKMAERGFKPEDLRLPHLQEMFSKLLSVGQSEAQVGQIDWDEVIANWHLPFPETKGKRGKGKR